MADFSGMINAIKDWAVGKFITEIPIGSDTVVGAVKADGTTTTIDSDGTIHATGGGGGTGTTDYNGLSNKPSIGDVTLSGNKTLADLGIQPEGNYVTEEGLEQKGFITGISKEDVTEALGYTPPEKDTTYAPETLGFGYGLCNTAENVLEKIVNLFGYELVVNGYVAVKFSNAVPANSTIKINGKSEKSIFFKGSAITDGIIGAGDVALFVYDGGSYRLISVDKSLAPEFSEALERTNISSGESLSVIFAKVMKWFSDLKPHAFVAPITNLLTTVEGSALDATMGTELNNKIAANATAIEEVNVNLNEVLNPTLLWSGSATNGDTINFVKDLSTFNEIVFYINSGISLSYKSIQNGTLIKAGTIITSDSGTVPLMFTATFTRNSNTQLVMKALTAHQLSSGAWSEIPNAENYKITQIYGLK